MTKHRWLYLPVALVAISAVSIAQAATPSASPDCAKERFLQELTLKADPVGGGEPLSFGTLARGETPAPAGPASRQSAFSEDQCFDIYCSDGTTAGCCGSEDTCRWVCETYCGEPCIFIWP